MNDLQENIVPLNEEFYQRETLIVANQLVGKIIYRKIEGSVFLARITEVEAYLNTDEASHSFRGKTQRNAPMFESGGIVYVYFIYGVHYCFNIVTNMAEIAEAVLIRAAEPITDNFIYSTVGPGNFAKAFSFNKDNNYDILKSDSLFIYSDNYQPEIISTTRIGISKAKELPFRFFDKKSQFVSKLK